MPCRRARPEAPGPLLHWLLSGESFFIEAAEGAEASPSNAQAKGLTFLPHWREAAGLKAMQPTEGARPAAGAG
jgi:hypothetical protein